MSAGDRLLNVAASVADGTPVDWDNLRARAADEEWQVLDALRTMSVLAGFHRSSADGDDTLLETTLAPTSGGAARDIGGFVLAERLGGGSQGEVYRAFDTRLERDVALKLRKLPAPNRDLGPILREGRLLAKLRHQHIVSVYGIEVVGESVGISMELIDGETLDAIVRRDGCMPPEDVARIATDLSEALVAVHDAGLIHRDVKAQNVMLEHGGRVVLMDFGTGAFQNDIDNQTQGGTPLYLAPELLRGGPASVASDLYALGTMMFFLLSGRFPFEARTFEELSAVMQAPAPSVQRIRPDVPTDLVLVIDRCLERRPEARFPSAHALLAALRPSVARRDSNHEPRNGPPSRLASARRVLRFAAPALILGAIAGGLAMRSAGTPAASPVVAVQSFRDLTGSEQTARMAEGLTNSLVTELGRLKSLRVVSAPSVRDADKSDRLPELVQQAGVTAFIRGTIDVSGERVRAHVSAVDALTQNRLWQTTLERDVGEFVKLPDDLTREIAERLGLELTETHRTLLSRRQAINVEALDAYYRGWAEAYRLTRSGRLEAERQFRKAVELAPDFAPARSALAYALFVLGSSFRVLDPQQAHAQARAEAERALALDPTWAHAHGVLGLLSFTFDWDWVGAERHFGQAIELNPSDANVRGLYAQLLMLQNRLVPALSEARVAYRLDPMNANRRSAISAALYYARRNDEAIAELEALQTADPNSSVAHFGLARYYSAAGRFDDALRQLETAPYKNEPPPKAEYVRILAIAGRHDDAQRRLPELLEFYDQGTLAPDYLAYVYLALGDQARALSLLHDAVNRRSPSVVWAHVDPRFDALRLHPEFRSLMNQLGFAQ